MGEVPGPEKKPIIVNPENYEEMLKLLLREEEKNTEAVAEKYQTKDLKKQIEGAKAALKKKWDRFEKDRQLPGAQAREPIQVKEIIIDPQSEQIRNLREDLKQEIKKSKTVAETHFKKPEAAQTPETLSGRIKPTHHK